MNLSMSSAKVKTIQLELLYEEIEAYLVVRVYEWLHVPRSILKY